jgi:uncharacterized protein (DUF58 family)
LTSRLLPTPRLAFFAFAAAALAIGGGYVPAVRMALFGADAVLALAVVIDMLFAIGPAIDVDRQVAGVFSVGRPNVVTLHVRNRSWRPLRGTIGDDPLESCSAIGNPAPFAVAAGSGILVRYEIVPSRRGSRALGAITARYRSPLGLVTRQDRAVLPATVDVYPDVHAARALELLRR